MLVYLWASLLLLRWCSHACAQGLTSVPAVAPAPGPVAAAGQLYPYQNNLNPVVQPSAITDNGTDWCKPFKPCNRTGPAEGAIESSYSTGLAPAAGASSVRASAYRYASIVPPSAVDWRQALTPWPVRNQAACGSCWAFAATAALEAAIAIATQVAQPPHLSEEESVDCLSGGCSGGWPGDALKRALSTTHGLASIDAYPYTAGPTAQAGTCKTAASTTSSYFDSVETVPTTVLALKQALSQQVVVVLVDATHWSGYTGGIYSGQCSSSIIDHVVVAVGYDRMSTGQEYWIIRNQWGDTTWGDAGYLYLPIKADDDTTGGTCGILGRASGQPPMYPFKAGAIVTSPPPPPPHQASTSPPPTGAHPPPPPPAAISSACSVGINPCGLGSCQVAGASYTCTCSDGFHVSRDANGYQVCAVDGMCEYWGIDLTCVTGTCIDDPDNWEYGYYCDCGSYEASTWSEDGSPTCVSGSSDVTCSDGSQPYTTVAGDQCWTIVYDNDISPDVFFANNLDLDCSSIFVGTHVCLTGSASPTSASSASTSSLNKTVTFSATLVDYSTATFAPTYDIYSQYISAVATAANVGTPSVTITNISPGSVVVATSVNTPSSQAAAFRNKLASGHVFSAGTFGQIDVSNVKTDGASTGGDSSSAGRTRVAVSFGVLASIAATIAMAM